MLPYPVAVSKNSRRRVAGGEADVSEAESGSSGRRREAGEAAAGLTKGTSRRRYNQAGGGAPPSGKATGRDRLALAIPDISQNLFDLSGYCSIVTGAGRGIGLALARGLARYGSDLTLVDADRDNLAAACAELEERGARTAAVPVDVTAPDAPDRITAAALELGGRIDVLINNAGIMGYSTMLDVTDEQWDRMHGINLRAPMRIMRAALAVMTGAGRGSVINIGSSWSSRASVFNQDGGGVDYCSAKAALQALSRAAAQDVAPQGVRVNAIAPGAVDTPMHAHHRDYLYEYERYIPLGRMQRAEDLVGPAVFLASDASAFITGQTIHVNGGLIMVD